jgi:predicted O-methyltransferase YrrM
MDSAAEFPLSVLADESRARAPLVDLPFDYDYDTWVLAKDSMRFLIALIGLAKPRRIIEYGSGVSTRVLCLALDRECVVRSFDHVEQYASKTRASLNAAARCCDVEVLHRPVGINAYHGKLLPFYRLERNDLAAVTEADLVLVDGPPGKWGREAALYVSFPVMRQGAILLLDDAGRSREQQATDAWKRFFGDAVEFEFMPEIGKGLLLARKRTLRAQGPGFTLKEKVAALHQASQTLWRNRSRGQP